MQNLNLSEEEIKIWSDAILQHSFNEDEWFQAREALLNTTTVDGKKPDEKNYVHTYRAVLKQLELVKLRLIFQILLWNSINNMEWNKLNKSSLDSI